MSSENKTITDLIHQYLQGDSMSLSLAQRVLSHPDAFNSPAMQRALSMLKVSSDAEVGAAVEQALNYPKAIVILIVGRSKGSESALSLAKEILNLELTEDERSFIEFLIKSSEEVRDANIN